MKTRLVPLVLLSVATAGVAAAQEPAFQGRPLNEWVKALHAPELIAREEAAVVLGKMGPAAKAAAADLTALLKDENPSLRFQVAVALWKIDRQAKPVLAVISAMLKESDRRLRLQATQVVVEMGKEASEAAPLLGDLLADPTEEANDTFIQTNCVKALLSFGEPAVPHIAKGLESRYFNTRFAANEGLGSMGKAAKAAVTPLTQALKHEDPSVRLLAAVALWRIDGQAEATIPHLIEGLNTKSQPLLMQRAAQSLGDMGPKAKAAVPALLKARETGPPGLRNLMEQSLKRIDPDAAKKAGIP